MAVTDAAGFVVGVDTHMDTHSGAVCDARGRVLAQLQVAATTAGYAQLLGWAGLTAGPDAVLTWAVEGTRHYGLGLARYLTAAGQQVTERACQVLCVSSGDALPSVVATEGDVA